MIIIIDIQNLLYLQRDSVMKIFKKALTQYIALY